MGTFGVNRRYTGLTDRATLLLISNSNDRFLKLETVERLSQRTITSYEFTLNHWLNNIEDQTTLMMTLPLGWTFSKYQKASGVLLNG